MSKQARRVGIKTDVGSRIYERALDQAATLEDKIARTSDPKEKQRLDKKRQQILVEAQESAWARNPPRRKAKKKAR